MNPVEVLIKMSGMSQKEFAEKVGIATSNLSEMKKGKRDIPLSKFISWCELFQIDIIEVFKKTKAS